MPTKSYPITIHIPKELGLSKSDIAKLKKVFQAQLTSIRSAKVTMDEVPFGPINTTSNPVTSAAAKSSARKKAGKAGVLPSRKHSKK